MNEKASKPFDVKHLMLSTVVLTAISTGAFLLNETTTHAASIDTNTTTAVAAAANNTQTTPTEENATTSADAQNSDSTVAQATPETQATSVATEEATSATSDSSTEETNSATSDSSTEAVQPVAEGTTTQTAVASDNNDAENITDNNTESVTDAATAETSSVVAPTTQAAPTEETTADTQATTSEKKSDDTTEVTPDDQSPTVDTATDNANATTNNISYYNETGFVPISGDVTVVTPGAKEGYPAQVISANGKEYVYDYQSGDNSVYLSADSAYIPNVDNISKLVEQQLGDQGIKVNADLNQVSQADLENARTADTITEGDTDYRNQVLAQDGLTSQGNLFTIIPIHLENVGSDEDAAKRILKNIAVNATDYGLAIGQLKNGTYVSYMEYARKDEASEDSDSNLYTVEYKSNDGVELHSSTQESADDLAPLPISSYTYDHWTVDDENKTATMYYHLTDGLTDTSNSTELSDTFYEAVNLFRENNGLKAITADQTLATDAQKVADEAAGNLTVGDTEKQVTTTSSDPVHTTTTVSGAFIPSEYDEGEGLDDIIDDGVLKISGGNGSEALIDLYNAATTDVGIGITKGSDGKLYYTVKYNMDNDLSWANTKPSTSAETTDETVDPADSTGTDTSVATTTEPTDTTDATTATKPAENTEVDTATKPTDSSDTKAADSTESVTTQASEDSASAVTDSTVTTAASTTAVKVVNTPAASVKATNLQVTTPVSTQAISETQVSPAIETKEEASSVEATDSTSDVQNAEVKEASVLPQTNEKTGFIGQLMGLVILGLTFGISFVRKSRKSTNE
ncbi:CAP domain-containing protein [Enterococcus hailinensis]|uniref:CAP domain-containing protein n=1 Tax=Enterococcus hailinensis TaxID=3238988 RepID=UPI0038B3ABE4